MVRFRMNGSNLFRFSYYQAIFKFTFFSFLSWLSCHLLNEYIFLYFFLSPLNWFTCYRLLKFYLFLLLIFNKKLLRYNSYIIHPFKMYDSRTFSIFTEWSITTINFFRTLLFLQKTIPYLHPPQPQKPTNLFLILRIFLFWTLHVNKIT